MFEVSAEGGAVLFALLILLICSCTIFRCWKSFKFSSEIRWIENKEMENELIEAFGEGHVQDSVYLQDDTIQLIELCNSEQ